MDVIFNDKVLYINLLKQHEKKENDYVVLNDTPKDDSHVVPHAPQQQKQLIPQTSLHVRWSTGLIRPPKRFSLPVLYFIDRCQ